MPREIWDAIMTENSAKCWKCDAVLAELHARLPRTEECPNCGADLHVCRMCNYYDTRVNNSCREPIAEFVSNKMRANFCGYFELIRSTGSSVVSENLSAASDELNDLFGLPKESNAKPDSVAQLNDLFGTDNSSE